MTGTRQRGRSSDSIDDRHDGQVEQRDYWDVDGDGADAVQAAVAIRDPRPRSIPLSNARKPGLALRTSIIVICALVAWPVGTVLLADLVDDDPDHVLTFRPHDGTMLARSAETERIGVEDEPDLLPSPARAREALLSNPLAARALLVLADEATSLNQTDRADSLVLHAAQRNLTDPAIQSRAVEILNRRGRAAEALARADAMMRAHPGRRKDYLPFVISLLANDDTRDMVADRLSVDPPWRIEFFKTLARFTQEPRYFLSLWSAIEKRGGAITDADIQPALSAMIAVGDHGRAYLTWISVIDESARPKEGHVFDGGFEIEPSGLPFEWSVDRVRGAVARRVPRLGKTNDRVMRIDFLGARVPYRHTYQLLRLQPGQYKLASDISVANLNSEGKLMWRLACANQDKTVLADLLIPRGTARWQTLSSSFTVPDKDCGAQDLRLTLVATARLDRKISGTVLLDNVKVTDNSIE